ncbi:unnamed protein product, partial [Rotaria sp. Silwood2]
ENTQRHTSAVWSTFGFPIQLVKDGEYQRIYGFASCFESKATYTFQSSGCGSTKHLLRYVCLKLSSSSEDHPKEPLEKLFKSKQKVQPH